MEGSIWASEASQFEESEDVLWIVKVEAIGDVRMTRTVCE